MGEKLVKVASAYTRLPWAKHVVVTSSAPSGVWRGALTPLSSGGAGVRGRRQLDTKCRGPVPPRVPGARWPASYNHEEVGNGFGNGKQIQLSPPRLMSAITSVMGFVLS
eukprot:2524968-Amphidinium_carterae.2